MHLILGMGKSGEAARQYCIKHHLPYRCYDRNPGKGVESDGGIAELNGVTSLIKAPGIPLEHPWIVAARAKKIPVCTEIDLALPRLQHKTLIGVTGSNGKTTTVMALQAVFGQKARAVGNIGTPLLDVLETPEEILVIELSSFQLETIQIGPWFDAAVILNITPNHLDYHKTFERYQSAKLRLKECLKPDGFFLTEKQFAPLEEIVESFFKKSYRKGADKLYAHDRSNFAAAYAISSRFGIEQTEFGQRITGLKKPPHRLEKVGEFRGVSVINDSKSTSVDATLKAVEAVAGPLHLIVGGVDKGGDYRLWLPLFRGKVASVFAIGEAASKIGQSLGEEIAVQQCMTLEKAVESAFTVCKPGDTLLLSPGCSSYDQFRNFEERGERFKQLVQEEGGKHEPT